MQLFNATQHLLRPKFHDLFMEILKKFETTKYRIHTFLI